MKIEDGELRERNHTPDTVACDIGLPVPASDPMARRRLGVSGVPVSEDKALDNLEAILDNKPEPD